MTSLLFFLDRRWLVYSFLCTWAKPFIINTIVTYQKKNCWCTSCTSDNLNSVRCQRPINMRLSIDAWFQETNQSTLKSLSFFSRQTTPTTPHQLLTLGEITNYIYGKPICIMNFNQDAGLTNWRQLGYDKNYNSWAKRILSLIFRPQIKIVCCELTS